MDVFFALLISVAIYFFPSFLVYCLLRNRQNRLEERLAKLTKLLEKSYPEQGGKAVWDKAKETNPELLSADLQASEPDLITPPKPEPRIAAARSRSVSGGGRSFHGKMREWKVFPPEGMPLEIAVMQWWAPRVGGVLALLALIFFGVWAAQFSSALVKVLEMLAVAVAVTGAGIWVSRRGNASVGGPLTATGTTMFYLVALAAGTFPATKIFDDAGWALLAQLVAIAPTVFLGRGKFLPMLLSLVFAFISSLFAVFNGAGTAALLTSFLAYALGAWFCTKKNTLGFLLAGAIGAFLPLWVINPHTEWLAESLMAAGNAREMLLALLCGLGAYLGFFIAGILLPAAVLQKTKDESFFGKFIYVFSCLHALLATGVVLDKFTRELKKIPVSLSENLSLSECAVALFFSCAAFAFLTVAITNRIRFRENRFLFEFNLVAGALALPAAIFFGCGADGGNVLFYLLLAESALLAYAGRAFAAKSLLLPMALCFLCAPLGLENFRMPFETCLYAGTGLIAFGWFFGDKKQWGSDDLCVVAHLIGMATGIFLGIRLYLTSLELSVPVVAQTVFPLSCLLLSAAGMFLPRFGKAAFGWICVTWICVIMANMLGEVHLKGLAFSHWAITDILMALIAVPVLRRFLKDGYFVSVFEIAFTASLLVGVTGICFNAGTPAFAFLLPVLALLLGTPWRKNSAAFPLLLRGSEISALPLFLAALYPWESWASGAAIPLLILVYLSLPFAVPAMRNLLRERPWVTAASTVAGSACLLISGHTLYPRFLTAEAASIALALIFAGLFVRVRIVRVVGIVLLAGGLLRLFVVDIDDTVWRIVAFALVSFALFLLGFAYQALSRRIESR